MDLQKLNVYYQLASWIYLIYRILTGVRSAWKRRKERDIFIVSKFRQLSSANKFLATVILLAIISWFFSLYLFLAKPSWQFISFQPNVYEPFEPLYAKHKTGLGNRIASVENPDHVYQAAYQNAMVIYVAKLGAFYRLDNTYKWTRCPELDWEESPWLNDTRLRQLFSPPQGLNPPYGGVAKHWQRDPTEWTRIGWLKWHRYLHGVHYQEFEHGIIMGNFLLNPEIEVAGNVFVLFDDSSWEALQGTLQNNPTCSNPPSR